jgi:hypothetical protein
VIINSIRDRVTQKRGGIGRRSPCRLRSADNRSDEETILKVHEALDVLEEADPRLAPVAQMREFGGYSEKEIAEALEVTAHGATGLGESTSDFSGGTQVSEHECIPQSFVGRLCFSAVEKCD